MERDQPVSQGLGLRLVVEEHLLIFYRLDNGDRLLPPDEIWEQLTQDQQQLQQARQRAEEEKRRAVEEK